MGDESGATLLLLPRALRDIEATKKDKPRPSLWRRLPDKHKLCSVLLFFSLDGEGRRRCSFFHGSGLVCPDRVACPRRRAHYGRVAFLLGDGDCRDYNGWTTILTVYELCYEEYGHGEVRLMPLSDFLGFKIHGRRPPDNLFLVHHLFPVFSHFIAITFLVPFRIAPVLSLHSSLHFIALPLRRAN